MEIKLTASVIMAVEWALRLTRGHIPGAEQPGWCNFDFFNRIKATPIRRTERIEAIDGCCGYWNIERTVEFFYCGARVAIVELAGRKIDGCNNNLDNGNFWGARKIGYFRSFGGGMTETPRDWTEIKLPSESLSARYVP